MENGDNYNFMIMKRAKQAECKKQKNRANIQMLKCL